MNVPIKALVNKRTIRTAARFAQRELVKNAPTILTTFAAGGVVATALLTHKATLKADQYVKNTVSEEASEETVKAVKLQSLKYYIPPVATGALTIGCLVGANYLNFKKITALAAACSVAETALTEHRDKIEELLGAKALEDIDNDIARDAAKVGLNSNEEALITGHGDYLCCEGYLTGAMFRANEDWIRRGLNDYNELVNMNTYASWNDFLSILGLHEVAFGDEVGYNVHANGLLRIRFTYDRDPTTGEPYLVIMPINKPISTYMDIL